jgi:uncharacterized membrane protein YccC
MPDSAVAAPSLRHRIRLPHLWSGQSDGTPLVPKWSVPAAMRAARATIVIPALFALTFKVIGDLQMALFATFGSFATLVLASFGGTRRDKAIAHLGLALVGSAAVIIGTLVSWNAFLAAAVTIPVAFAIFFAGVAGPNAAGGITAALLAYVLPVASAGNLTTIPSRLAGWWLASVVCALAVLLLSPQTPGDRLREAAAASAATLASHLDAAVRGDAAQADLDRSIAAKHKLMDLFVATPYRPTGLATADQGLANVAQELEWCTSLITDALDGHLDLRQAAAADRDLLGAAATVLRDVAALLTTRKVTHDDVSRDIERLQQVRMASAAHQREMSGDPGRLMAAAQYAVHAQSISVVARGAAADAMIAAGQADLDTIAAQRRSWYGGTPAGPAADGRLGGVAGAAGLAARHASMRSVWFRSAARGAVALALAVLVAHLTDVQHGFWVVLGTLSVLRTNAAATGSTVVRALAGTVVGFAVGAALMLAIGTSTTALWIALPVAVLVAAYSPGTAPFAVGQAAFTVTVVVLFNLLVPAGWKVGLVRIQDVAIGCAVSLVVGVLFWPRGAGSVVGDDLADAFRRGADYLQQAVDWCLGLAQAPPDTAAAAISAGIRLDDALRLYLAEQGTKRLSKQDLWNLVMATMRLRLTAVSLAALRPAGTPGAAAPGRNGRGDPALRALAQLTTDLTGFYERVAAEVGPPHHDKPAALAVPALPGLDGPDGQGDSGTMPTHQRVHALWVREHLYHLGSHAPSIIEPAERLARLRRYPWWQR